MLYLKRTKILWKLVSLLLLSSFILYYQGNIKKEAPTSFKLMWQACQFGHFNMIKVLKIITIITSNFQDFKIWNTIPWVLGFFKRIKINISDPHWDANPAYNSWSLPAHSMESTITSIILKFEIFYSWCVHPLAS